MSWKKWAMLAGVALIAAQTAAAREGGFPYKLMNRLTIAYDDNFDELKESPKASWKIVEELELAIDLNLQQTFLGMNLRPNFVFWENRPGDDSDFHFYADFILNHSFSRRIKLSLKDTFRRAEAPELIENGETYREDSTYYYNSLDGALSMLVRPKIYVDVKGGYSFVRYDENDIAKDNDYNKYKASTRLRYQLIPETEVSADLGYENIDYNESDLTRQSQMYNLGAGVEHMFSPNLMGSARAGWSVRDNKDTYSDDESAPYGELGITILPSPATRISLGGSYMLRETDIYPYTQQQTMRGYASLSYDITPKLTLNLSGSATVGDYDAKTMPKDATVGDLPSKQYETIKAENPDVPNNAPLTEEYIDAINNAGENENVYRMSTVVQYKINRINWVEVGWNYTEMDSDLRENFDRNIYQASWKLKL